MASQVIGKSAYYEWPSYIRGYHEYKSAWSAAVGETLRITMELNNLQDPFAMAMIKDDSSGNGSTVVGHVPRAVSWTVSFFLGKDGSVGFCEVTGEMVNRDAGFGLEIPCVYRFYGCLAYIERLKNLLQL